MGLNVQEVNYNKASIPNILSLKDQQGTRSALLQSLSGQPISIKMDGTSVDVKVGSQTVKTLPPYQSCTAIIYPLEELLSN